MDLTNLIKEINQISLKQINILNDLVNDASQIIIIGNGGSNSIASHIAIDYQKFLNKKDERLYLLDVCRGIAAYCIVIFHYKIFYNSTISIKFVFKQLIIVFKFNGLLLGAR
jgi:hypothetical protein